MSYSAISLHKNHLKDNKISGSIPNYPLIKDFLTGWIVVGVQDTCSDIIKLLKDKGGDGE